jgi:hypothetical protein
MIFKPWPRFIQLLTSENVENPVNEMAVNYLTIKLKEKIFLIKAVKKIPEIMGTCNYQPLANNSTPSGLVLLLEAQYRTFHDRLFTFKPSML